jgi:hypothetical protein
VETDYETYWKPRLSLRLKLKTKKLRYGAFSDPVPQFGRFLCFYILFFDSLDGFISMYYVEKQINSQEFPWALTASFIMLFCIALTYAAARFGQHKGKMKC